MTRHQILEDSSGLIGIESFGSLNGIFEEKELLLPERNPLSKLTEVGYIELDIKHRTDIYQPYALARYLRQRFINSNEESEVFFLGSVSEFERLSFARLTDTVMMGFNAKEDSLFETYANVYYFKKVGEVKGLPIYSYMHDMVISDNQIKWVTGKKMMTVSHDLTPEKDKEPETCPECDGTGFSVTSDLQCSTCDGTGEVLEGE